MAKSHVLTGAKVALYVNGKAYAKVTGFRWTSTTPKRAIYGVDSVDPFELAPTITKCVGTLSVVRLSGDGGAEGAGLTAPYDMLPNEKYCSIVLLEPHSDLILFEARQCSVIAQSWDAPSRGIMTGSIEFEALSWNNEVRPAHR